MCRAKSAAGNSECHLAGLKFTVSDAHFVVQARETPRFTPLGQSPELSKTFLRAIGQNLPNTTADTAAVMWKHDIGRPGLLSSAPGEIVGGPKCFLTTDPRCPHDSSIASTDDRPSKHFLFPINYDYADAEAKYSLFFPANTPSIRKLPIARNVYRRAP
ncbi:hypothetical protein CSHISOI_07945 [Colletotrichum shisoi]|uniref:Uncharacterized protein n=1 Tax=Colletotrichum shisoi TaxID=2078593 RepID=A0A5Q4BKK6_9PEZI|nr:hypothetical protein CSHISOI_07945 [Colletotrichum shisoi]